MRMLKSIDVDDLLSELMLGRRLFGERAEARSSRHVVWHGAGKRVAVHGYEITGGLIYVRKTAPVRGNYVDDSCVINPALDVLPGEPPDGPDWISHFPSYARISPECRGAYLKWLADGRSDPTADIGYVFLFFYGLEQRLLLDGQSGKVPASERDEIVREINRLLQIYGEDSSFRYCASALIVLEWALYRNSQSIPDGIELDDEYYKRAFRVQLAKYAANKQAIPADIALQWLKFSSLYRPRTAARRCAKEVEALFIHRYRRRYAKGLMVRPNKPRLEYRYIAASGSLFGLHTIRIPELSDPFRNTAPVKKIKAIFEECERELGSYSRFVLNTDPHSDPLTALALLPVELMRQSPVIQAAKSRLDVLCENGPGLLTVDDLHECFGGKSLRTFASKQSKNLAALVEGAGYGLAPDIRFHDSKPINGGKVAVFPKGYGGIFLPSGEYRLLCTTLKLGAMICQAGGGSYRSEEAALKSLVTDNGGLNQTEKDSLLAFLQWCLDTPQKMAGIRRRLGRVDKAGMKTIGHRLVLVAVADGRINPGKVALLEKFYPMLGLDKKQVSSDLHSLATESEPVTVARRESDPAYSIPSPAKDMGRKQIFRLDEELLRRHLEETHLAREVLEEIFVDREENRAEEKAATTVASSENPLNKLDKAHRDLFHLLIQQETWERGKLQHVCQELGLMVDGAMERLNEWFFDNADTPLIEDGETVWWIDVNSAKEIMYAR